MKEKINESYFSWLCSQIEKKDSLGLEDFLSDLHSYPFLCKVPNDDNRVEEGIALRYKFTDEKNVKLSEDFLSGPCTLLEMLIALADRMDFILFDQASRRWKWFWLFIDNLKLQKYTNDDNERDILQKRKFNRIVINKFLRREYQANGKGGLFPLENPSSDQREIEIWYQMAEYINENYDI